MPERIITISDTHFGRGSAAALSADALRPLWQDASQLIVNGDVAEVHHPEHWSEAARQTIRLFELCEQDDVTLTLLSGNHDPYITDHRHIELAGGLVFITHGDVLHPAVAPWSPAAGRIRSAFERAMAQLDPAERNDLHARLRVAQHAASAEWATLAHQAGRSTIWRMLVRPWAIARVLWYWRIFPKLAARFAATHAPKARYLIFGHTHHPGIWTVGDRTIINTGSFGFPGTPRAVILEDDELSVWRIGVRKGEYRLHSQPLARLGVPSRARMERR